MLRQFCISSILIFTVLNGKLCAQDLKQSFNLVTLEGNNITLSLCNESSHTVVVLLLPDCPACQTYSRTLNQLHTSYRKSSVEFYGIFPGHFSSLEEMKDYRQRYKIGFPLLHDPDKKLVKALHGTTAPEVFVCNKRGEVVYSGRIDDWMYALGKKRSVITRHDLKEAIDALVNGKKIEVSRTVPIGCIIE